MRFLALLFLLTGAICAKEIVIKVIVDDNVSVNEAVFDLRGKVDANLSTEEIATLLSIQQRELYKNALKSNDPEIKKYEIEELFGIKPYKKNYILPYAYTSEKITGREQQEAEFQISLKKEILPTFLDGQFFIAYTQNSFWQIYDSADSRPFRETNYAPEIYYEHPIDKSIGDLELKSYKLGYIHQSNGQGVENSRSWDRIKGEVAFDYKPFSFNLSAWYRLPEDAKKNPQDPKGDDNPNIEDYIGYGELEIKLPYGNHEFGATIRNNLKKQSDNRGSLKLEYSYPLWTTYLYIQYFSGYDESLIDYDRSIDKIGIGILLNRF